MAPMPYAAAPPAMPPAAPPPAAMPPSAASPPPPEPAAIAADTSRLPPAVRAYLGARVGADGAVFDARTIDALARMVEADALAALAEYAEAARAPPRSATARGTSPA